jgi:hypothetical protein
MSLISKTLSTVAIGIIHTIFVSILYSAKASEPSVPLTLEIINDDMKLPHVARPHGVPLSYGWALAPRRGQFHHPERYKAITAWGQVYQAVQGSKSQNTRVQIRNIRAYRLSKKNRKWYLVQHSLRVEGAAYREDFKNDLSQPANLRNEADGSSSVRLVDGYNYHFWPSSGRSKINTADVVGVFVAVDARLIIDNPKKSDDRSIARYLLSAGADYWTSLTAPWDNFKTNADIGIGRFRYVSSTWQTFTMTSLSETELRRFPPPLY